MIPEWLTKLHCNLIGVQYYDLTRSEFDALVDWLKKSKCRDVANARVHRDGGVAITITLRKTTAP